MGMFSARGRLSRPTGYKSPIRLHSEYSLAAAVRQVGAIPAKLRLAAIAATNNAGVVAVLLILAALALAAEMAASFHLL